MGTVIDPPVRTDTNPNIDYTEYTEIRLPTTSFIVIATLGHSYQIKNKSGNPVYVAMNDDPVNLASTVPQECIGGTVFEIRTDPTKYTWIRAGVANSVISIRPTGTVDPSASIDALIVANNELSLKISTHIADKKNVDHAVTKQLVDLGNIPNAKSDEPATNDPEILATTKLTAAIKAILDEHIAAVTGNVHGVTKVDVKLGNVQNYPVADAANDNELASTITDKYVSVAAAYRIVQLATAVARSASPQLIIDAPVSARPDGWFIGECDAPPAHLIQKPGDPTKVLVKTGLQVSFGNDYKSALSEKLAADIEVPLPVGDGSFYVYVDISNSNLIIGANTTVLAPLYDVRNEGATGDFFNTALCQMFDKDGNRVRRVYIGKVIVLSGIPTIIQVPIGKRYVVPILTPLERSDRKIIDNPFMTKFVNTVAEVNYMSNFHATGWNDQIGVMANTHPAMPDQSIVVQCGQMGFLCSGRESGNSFGSAFTTVQTSMRTRVVIERTLF